MSEFIIQNRKLFRSFMASAIKVDGEYYSTTKRIKVVVTGFRRYGKNPNTRYVSYYTVNEGDFPAGEEWCLEDNTFAQHFQYLPELENAKCLDGFTLTLV